MRAPLFVVLVSSAVAFGASDRAATAQSVSPPMIPVAAVPGRLAQHDGLTVAGSGTATVDADALAFDVRLSGVGRPLPTASGAPASGPQSLGEVEAAPRALASSLTAAGANSVGITFDASLDGHDAFPFDVHGLLPHPTHDRILALVLSGALTTMSDGSTVPIARASGQLVVSDCSAAQQRAVAAALDDAHRAALAVADHAHLHLGPVQAIVVAGGSDCPTPATALRSILATAGGLPLDGPYRVTVRREVSVTYAIR